MSGKLKGKLNQSAKSRSRASGGRSKTSRQVRKRSKQVKRSSVPSQKFYKPKSSRLTGGEMVVYNKRELWFSVNHDGNGQLKIVKKFQIDQYPPWLKRMCSCYEYIRPKYIAITIETGYPTVVSGLYYASYNASIADTELAENLNPDKMSSQQYAISSSVYKKSTMYIPRQVFQLPKKGELTKSDNTDAAQLSKSWYFDFQFLLDCTTAGAIKIFIDYKVELITPSIRNV